MEYHGVNGTGESATNNHEFRGEKTRLLEHEKDDRDFDVTGDETNYTGGRYADGRVTYPLILSVVVSLFGSFQFGWHTGVVNFPEKTIKEDLDLKDALWGVVVAIFCVGGLIGAMTISQVADKLGRKATLTLNSTYFVITGILQFTSGSIRHHQNASFAILLLSRITAGMGCGGATVVVPMYLGEVASRNLRGAFGSLSQFAVVMGVFLSQLIGWHFHASSQWQWLLSITGFLGLVQVLAGVSLLESPKWLATKNRLEEAKQTLLIFRDYSEEDASAELDEIMLTAGKQEEAPTFVGILKDVSLRKPLIAAIVLTVSQQISGINAVFYYSTTFFEKVNKSLADPGTLLSSGVNVLAMGVAVQLMERAGRRKLLLSGSLGMAVSALLIVITMSIRKVESEAQTGLGILVIVFILSFVVFFEIGLGAIPWQIGGEIFPDGPRATAMSLAAGLNWISNGVVAVVFPIMVTHMGQFVFLPFSVILFCCWIFTYMVVPETKGRTIADILDAFHRRSPLTLSNASAHRPKQLGDPANMDGRTKKGQLQSCDSNQLQPGKHDF